MVALIEDTRPTSIPKDPKKIIMSALRQRNQVKILLGDISQKHIKQQNWNNSFEKRSC